jgi:hypothetical protein
LLGLERVGWGQGRRWKGEGQRAPLGAERDLLQHSKVWVRRALRLGRREAQGILRHWKGEAPLEAQRDPLRHLIVRVRRAMLWVEKESQEPRTEPQGPQRYLKAEARQALVSAWLEPQE